MVVKYRKSIGGYVLDSVFGAPDQKVIVEQEPLKYCDECGKIGVTARCCNTDSLLGKLNCKKTLCKNCAERYKCKKCKRHFCYKHWKNHNCGKKSFLENVKDNPWLLKLPAKMKIKK